MSKVDITIPDLGDFSDVEIIEVLVAEGDTVAVDDSLITLETDKASMEVPAADAGTIVELTVKVGDTVSEGDVIGRIDTGGENGAATASGQRNNSDSDSDGDGDGGAGHGTGRDRGRDAARADDDGDTQASIDVTVPDIGDAKDVEVIEVLVSVGDVVEVEQSLVTLESDKASMEVPSPAAGKVASISVSVGDKVDEGSPLLVLAGATPEGAAPEGAAREDDRQADERETSASEPGDSARPAAGAASAQGQRDTDRSAVDTAAARREPPTRDIPDDSIRKAHASPGVRRYARIHGADLSRISGSGPKGRILKEDVIAFIKATLEASGAAATAAPAEGAGIPPIPAVDFSKFGEFETRELGRINKLSAANLHRAWLNLPMVTYHEEADITDMEAFRKALKNTAQDGDPKVTGLAFHMKALAACLRQFPKFNTSLTPDGQSLIFKQYCHIGIAVDTPNGLVVPVFRDVDKKGINALAEEMAAMSSRARAKKLKPEEMQGASMTISSLGGIGGSAFTPIVNPPEVAILGITRARMQPVWNGEDFVPRLICPLDLTFDHRVIDGAEAARFLSHYCLVVGDVRRLLL